MSATTRPRSPRTLPRARALVLVSSTVLITLAWVRYGAALGIVLAVILSTVLGLLRAMQGRSTGLRIDRAADHLRVDSHRGNAERQSARPTLRLAERIDAPGVFVGRTVRGRRPVWGSWEDMHMDVWGPRTGKTASRAIPAVVNAPGLVVVTSNKRDIVDATRGVREKRGPVWVFDPQGQAGEPPSWWWNPLTFVGDNVAKAMMLASFFSGINRQAHVRSDGYLLPAGESLFAAFLLAASIDGRPITDTHAWLVHHADDTPHRILRAGGHHLAADAAEFVRTAPGEQRAGVYGTALQIASPLTDPDIAEWVTPGTNPGRPEFRHLNFAQRDDSTLFLLSEETNRHAAPFILTLISGLAYAAEGRAIASPGGRLAVPAMFVLDEAANVCPWRELPFLYSHYGSRGIIMMTILQSWAQGVAVWGEAGMASMWSAANVRVYGGGAADGNFLTGLSRTTPMFERPTAAIGYPVRNPFARSLTFASRAEHVLNVADLASLPRGRALVQLSGAEPALVRTLPWWEGPHAADIRASLRKYAPQPQPRAHGFAS